MLGAGATVSNSGPVSLAITAGTLSSPLGDIGPVTGAYSNGTVTGAGALTLPKTGAVFNSFLVHVTNHCRSTST
jgi:hypothetical protein